MNNHCKDLSYKLLTKLINPIKFKYLPDLRLKTKRLDGSIVKHKKKNYIIIKVF